MPSTGIISGNDVKIFKQGVLIGCARSVTFSAESETASVACKEDGVWSRTINTTKSWTMSIEGAYKLDATIDVFNHLAAFKSDSEFTVSFGTNLSGDKQIVGAGRITNIEVTGNEGEIAGYNLTISGQGEYSVITISSPY